METRLIAEMTWPFSQLGPIWLILWRIVHPRAACPVDAVNDLSYILDLSEQHLIKMHTLCIM